MCSVNGSEAGGDRVLIMMSLFFCRVNQVVLMLINLHEKSREVCIKARSPYASLTMIGQVTKYTTVKWPIPDGLPGQNFMLAHISIYG